MGVDCVSQDLSGRQDRAKHGVEVEVGAAARLLNFGTSQSD